MKRLVLGLTLSVLVSISANADGYQYYAPVSESPLLGCKEQKIRGTVYLIDKPKSQGLGDEFPLLGQRT